VYLGKGIRENQPVYDMSAGDWWLSVQNRVRPVKHTISWVVDPDLRGNS